MSAGNSRDKRISFWGLYSGPHQENYMLLTVESYLHPWFPFRKKETEYTIPLHLNIKKLDLQFQNLKKKNLWDKSVQNAVNHRL